MTKKAPPSSVLPAKLSVLGDQISEHLLAKNINTVFLGQVLKNELHAIEKALESGKTIIHDKLQRSCKELFGLLHETVKTADRNVLQKMILPVVQLVRQKLQELEMLAASKK